MVAGIGGRTQPRARQFIRSRVPHCRNANRAIAKRDRCGHGPRAPSAMVGSEGVGAMRSKFFRGNVFVANLPAECSDDQLAEAFDSYGIVLSAHVARDPATGERLRYGFVDIATDRAAQRAVAEMNGASLGGRNIEVRISERPATKRPNSADGGPRRAPLRLAARAEDAAGDGAGAAPAGRRRPSFQVEHRSLPRRLSPR
jgi:RNA recognition motif-containing protein